MTHSYPRPFGVLLGAFLAIAILVALASATAASASESLTVRTRPATNITGTTAQLNGEVDPKGNPVIYTFRYGKTEEYGSESEAKVVEEPSGVIQAAIVVNDLEPLTTYHFQIVGLNKDGLVFGKDGVFTTGDFRPGATTEGSSLVKNGSAYLNGSVDPKGFNTKYQFEYGPTASYGSSVPVSPKSVGSGSSPVAVSERIEGLSANTPYHYRLVATSNEGTTYGADRTLEIHPPRVEADSYPATLSGAQVSGKALTFALPSHLIEGKPAQLSCTTATLAGSLASASSSVGIAPTFSGCTLAGVGATVNANGCSFVASPVVNWTGSASGPLEISCPAGKAIEAASSTCAVTISPKSGLQSVKLTNAAEPKAGLTAAFNASGLKYTVTKDGIGCALSGTGSAENGTLTGSATVTAKDGGGSATGLYVSGEEEAPHAPAFEAEAYTATLSGAQVSGKALTFALPSHTVEGSPAKITCTTATLAGSLAESATTVGLAPSYSGCSVAGVSATVNANGCSFVPHAESKSGSTYSGLLDISCPAGKAIEAASATCAVTISPKNGLSKAEYTGILASGKEAIEMTANASGLKYTVTKDGIGCALSGTGSAENGTLTGTATVTAKDGGGSAIGVRVGG